MTIRVCCRSEQNNAFYGISVSFYKNMCSGTPSVSLCVSPHRDIDLCIKVAGRRFRRLFLHAFFQTLGPQIECALGEKRKTAQHGH